VRRQLDWRLTARAQPNFKDERSVVVAQLSKVLDPAVNFVPELPLGGEDPLGRHALRFPGGCPLQQVRARTGDVARRLRAFDLLGVSR
jgi:hypothetical protein